MNTQDIIELAEDIKNLEKGHITNVDDLIIQRFKRILVKSVEQAVKNELTALLPEHRQGYRAGYKDGLYASKEFLRECLDHFCEEYKRNRTEFNTSI